MVGSVKDNQNPTNLYRLGTLLQKGSVKAHFLCQHKTVKKSTGLVTNIRVTETIMQDLNFFTVRRA